MPYFVLQTALLMLAAYVLGAILGCFLRQLAISFFDGTEEGLAPNVAGGSGGPPVIQTSLVEPAGSHADTQRFERALTNAPDQSRADVTVAAPAVAEPRLPASSSEGRAASSAISDSETQDPDPLVSPVAVAAAAAAASVAVVSPTRDDDDDKSSVSEEAVSGGPDDDLERVYLIDGATAQRLKGLGITRYVQIAEWTSEDVTKVETALGQPRRISRENWIEQARILSGGGKTAFAKARDEGRAWDVNWHRSSHVRNGVTTTAAGSAIAVANDAGAESRPSDELQRISGIDARIEGLLNENGVHRFDQIAAWSGADVGRIEGILKEPGRVARDSWIEQARWLSSADGNPAGGVAQSASSAISGQARSASTADVPRSELAGMRSVRSEVLVGEGQSTIGDDLKRIRGIGVSIENRLRSLGVMTYEQVANWTRADIDRISETLDFKGRIERENWVEQARILASGGQTDFSRRIDRGEI